MQLVIAGDITPEQGKEWVEKYFGSMKKDDYSFKADRGTLKTAAEATSHWITNKEATATEISINLVRPYEKKPDTIANRTRDIPLNMAYAMLNRRLEKMAKTRTAPSFPRRLAAWNCWKQRRWTPSRPGRTTRTGRRP